MPGEKSGEKHGRERRDLDQSTLPHAKMVWIYSSDAEAVSPRRPRPPGRFEVNLFVLVVASDAEMGEWLRAELERAGHRVLLAESGRRCIDLVQSGEVDVVLSDMEQCDLPGLDLLRELSGVALMPKVILTTSLLSDWRTSQAIRLGASAVLRRPFRMERLLSIMAASLEN
jgi:DNA-binding NtrC family response regulator